MAQSMVDSLKVALRAVDTHLAGLREQVQVANATRAQILTMLSSVEGSPEAQPALEPPRETTVPARDAARDVPRVSLVDRLTQFIADSEAGSTWKARDLARALYESDPTSGQVEGVRTYARRLVDRGLLVKNTNGSFTKPEVTSGA